MRGTPEAERLRSLIGGIIPACAGNTRSRIKQPLIPRDHPRMCGEHGEIFDRQRVDWGSSPHVRGTPVFRVQLSCCPGIIPACAGNTLASICWLMPQRDHPRMCGEHLVSVVWVARAPGSSPHVRGTPCRDRSSRPARGIIPACAGNTP